MLHTDKFYVRPTVYKLTTNLEDKLIQLDGWSHLIHHKQITSEETLGATYLKPVSYVSNDAGVYPDLSDDIKINLYGE